MKLKCYVCNECSTPPDRNFPGDEMVCVVVDTGNQVEACLIAESGEAPWRSAVVDFSEKGDILNIDFLSDNKECMGADNNEY